LAACFIKQNGWQDDFSTSKKRKEHKSRYEHCFQRATVRKFFEKAQALFDQVLPFPNSHYQTLPTQDMTRKQWKKKSSDLTAPDNSESEVKMTLPWQYMEFMSVFNGLELHRKGNSDGLRFLRKCGTYLYESEAETIEKIHKTEGEGYFFNLLLLTV
jgi:hypothetical protein